jgi:serine/threonine protein kinase
MNNTLRFCLPYERIVQVEKGICLDCGLNPDNSDPDKTFLSGLPEITPPILPTGTILMDRFKIKEFINKGRYGSVHLAEDRLRSMQVALKVTNGGPQYPEKALMQLHREMSNYSRILNFQHVIRVYDLHFVPWNGTDLLVLSMEYANGGTFRKWMVDHRKDLKARQTSGLDYFKQACRGVGDAHQVNVVHLDLKPENFLFMDRFLKVSDFGAWSFTQFLANSTVYHCDTFLWGCLGTPPYQSPEIINGQLDQLDARADIYSLGIILYELLNPKGCPPFGGSNSRFEEHHLKVPAPRLLEAGEKLAGVIAKCLEKNPANRYQSVAELLDDLEGCSKTSCKPGVPLEASTKETGGETEETWARASLMFSRRHFNEALTLIEKVLDAQPDHPGARQLKEELSSRFDQAEHFYREIDAGLDGGDLAGLIELLKDATSIYPEHPSARLVQAKLRALARQYRKAMEEGLKALQGERWESALECFRQALKIHPGVASVGEINRLLTKIDELRRCIDQALARGEFKTALRLACLVDQLVEQMKGSVPALRGGRDETS